MSPKETVTDFFGDMNRVYLNSTLLTASNLDRFALALRYEDKNVAYYTHSRKKPRKGKSDIFICHDKATGSVDWYEGLNDHMNRARHQLTKAS